VFVPAFYFYQFVAESEVQQKKGQYKPSAITVSLVYENNSALAAAFYDAVEKGMLN
jgi:hypothetical protein